MNKKVRIFPLMIVLLLFISCVAPAAAINTRASDYLAGYGISMEAIGNGRMEIFYDVERCKQDEQGWCSSTLC